MRSLRRAMIDGLVLATVLATLALVLVAISHPVAAAADPDVALFNPNNGQWHLRYRDGHTASFYYGVPGDTPLMGDWDCDGTDTVAMYRESTGFIYYRNWNNFGIADGSFFFGIPGDIPIAGDWNNDGCDTFGIYRNGKVFLRNSLSTGIADQEFWFGNPGDRPFAGDFTGDGADTIGLYRQSTGLAYFTESLPTGDVATTDNQFFYGIPSDRIIADDWDLDGDDSVGIYRPSDQKFYLSYENVLGDADVIIAFGQSTWLPAAGDLVPQNPGDTVNCSDFETRPQAQAWFDYYFHWYGDVANLDGDADGEPCESLPTGTMTSATVTGVTDGDTVTVRFADGSSHQVRLVGINAPEAGECMAQEATNHLTALVMGESVVLEQDVSETDQYGRFLRYLHLGDMFVNETLVAEGYALALEYPPDTHYAAQLEAAQDHAQASGLGLWATNGCGSGSAGDLVIVEVNYDAPGNDNENKNGEWVTIRNSGTASTVMTGWVLKDESASHRYSFPDGFTLAASAVVQVFTGCGTNTENHLYWCNPGTAVWNNTGDTAFLLDPEGNLVDSWSY